MLFDSLDSTAEPKHVLCLGRLHFEVIVKQLEYLPIRRTVFRSPEISISAAGSGFTTSTVLHKLGSRVTVAGALGADWQGDAFHSILRSKGISDRIARIDDMQTGMNVLAVDWRGLVKYVVSEGADVHAPSAIEAQPTTRDQFDWIHVGNANLFAAKHADDIRRYLIRMRNAYPDIQISADSTKSKDYASAFEKIADLIDVYFCNATEAQDATGEDQPADCAQRLLEFGVSKLVVIKRGANGVYWASRSARGNLPAYQVRRNTDKNVVGTGDVFCAAAVHCLANGLETEESLDVANLISAHQICSETPLVDLPSFSDSQIRDLRKEYSQCNQATSAKPGRTRTAAPALAADFDAARALPAHCLHNWMGAIRRLGKLTPDSVVLDAGCGTGRFAIPIAEEFGCTVIAVDRDAKKISLAKKKPTSGKIKWVREEFETMEDTLAHHSQTIDCIWTSSVVEDLVNFDPERLLRIFYKMLKKGGHLLIRTTAPELVDRIDMFQYFERAHEELRTRALAIPELWGIAVGTRFIPTDLMLFDDSEPMAVDEYISKLSTRAYKWSDVYDEDELQQCLSEYRDYLEAIGARACHDHRPSYLLSMRRP